MNWHVCTSMLLLLMMNFNILKYILFLIFHEHKNLKLNQFDYISKVANFRVLQFYPLKMNPVPEIWKTSTRRLGYSVFGFFLTSSRSSIVLIRIPFYFAYLLTLLQVTCPTDSKILIDSPDHA